LLATALPIATDAVDDDPVALAATEDDDDDNDDDDDDDDPVLSSIWICLRSMRTEGVVTTVEACASRPSRPSVEAPPLATVFAEFHP
jgi:hypothetical protein